VTAPQTVGAQKSSKASPNKQSQKIDQATVQGYVAEFAQSANDGTALRTVLEKLRSDKKVKLGEVNAILSAARGREVKVSKKADALKEIEQWYQRKIDTERRLKGAEDLY
jgi:hypothetical protein